MVEDCLRGGLSMVVGCHPGRVVTGAVCPWWRVIHGSRLSQGELSPWAGCLWRQVVSGQIVSGGLSPGQVFSGAMSLHPYILVSQEQLRILLFTSPHSMKATTSGACFVYFPSIVKKGMIGVAMLAEETLGWSVVTNLTIVWQGGT